MGGSLGLKSGGLRFYNQDLDGDGRRELGLGGAVPLGIGGFGADRTSETPVGDLVILGADGLLDALLPFQTSGLLPALNESVEGITKNEVSPARDLDDALWSQGGKETP